MRRNNYTFKSDNTVRYEEDANIFRFPRTEPFKRIVAGDLYRVPKDETSKEHVKRLKSYVSELFPPFDIKDGNLKNIFEELKNPESDREQVILELREAIPKINYDQMANLCLYLAFEEELNDHACWKLIEQCVYDDLKLFTFHDLCKIRYSVNHLKPKRTGHELDSALDNRIYENLEVASSHDMMLAIECFRTKRSIKFFKSGNKLYSWS